MRFRKRGFLSIVVAGVGLWISVVAHAGGDANPPRRYRLIFNSDGYSVAKDAKGDVDLWIENLFGPIGGSHVDALFWCDGAGGNTADYDSKVLERTGQRTGKLRPWIEKIMQAGIDPPEVVISEGRKRGIDVYYSLRFNDIHDSFIPDELATFKVEHPEWLIGEKQYGDVLNFPTALNFALPEVRELKFRTIEEIVRKYDFDGLEIDFLRSAPYFLPGQEEQNAHLLSGLLRRVRKLLDEQGRDRGRPYRLAVRVDENLETCRRDGFDVRTWIDESLIDYLIVGSGMIDMEVEEFKQLAAPKGVLVYPCLYGFPSKYSPMPLELAVGITLNYWKQGADGIYLFNWFVHPSKETESSGQPYMVGLLRQLGDLLQDLQPRVKFAADRGRPARDAPYSWMHCALPATLTTQSGLRANFRVGVDLHNSKVAQNITLRVTIDNLAEGDIVDVSINGKRVEPLLRYEASVLEAPLEAGHLLPGQNEAVVKLVHSSPTATTPRTVTAIEVDMADSRQEP
jgi:hypothetical protein